MLTTRRKLQIARVASTGLRAVRRPFGLGDQVTARRGGLNWQLDLREGIDLAIYLNVYQHVGRYVRNSVLRSGMTVMDIGANIGAFTLPLSAAVGSAGKVIAIEATRFAYEKLQANIARNPAIASRIVAVQAVLGATDDQQSDGSIYASWRLDNAGGDERHPAHGGRRMSTEGARWTTLDTLLESEPRLAPHAAAIGFVKLDVDGHELDVLRGARRFLEARRPDLLIEVAPYVQDERPGGQSELLAEITRLGYQMLDADSGNSLPPDAAALTRLIPHGAGIDVLCRPI